MSRAASLVITEETKDFSLEEYINLRITGFTPRQAALQAGYKSKRDYMKWEDDPYVQEQITLHVKRTRKEAVYTRDKVMEIVEDAVEVARIIADPTAMIRGAQEFNKMQGYYAPEKKEVFVSVEHTQRLQQMEEMSEEELLIALDKEQPYIDADFQELLPEDK